MRHCFFLFFIVVNVIFYKSNAQEINASDIISKSILKNGRKFLKTKNINAVSIGVSKEGNIYTEHFGELEKGKGNSPHDSTIYEIASVTKTMTGYLAAMAVLEGKFKLEDDIRLYLEGEFSNLQYNDSPIRIKHLLTHTSGLPKFLPLEMNNVFEKLNAQVPTIYYELEKTYNKEQFLIDLNTISIPTEPGTTYIYSNAGAELVGHILESVYNKPIDELFKESFLTEYKMLNTLMTLNDSQKKKLTRGYWMDNKDLSPNQLNTLWGTGSGMKMTLKDMMGYIQLQLNANDPIVSKSHDILYQKGKTFKVAYYWRVWHDKYGTSYNHHGGTSGTQNWLYIFPKYNLGISIMTNHSGPKTPNKLNKTIKQILKDIIDE